jgi:transposase
MPTDTVYVGLDVSKERIAACVLRGLTAKPLDETSLPNDPVKIRKYLKKLAPEGELLVGYEAGFSGYGLARAIQSWGYDGRVIAPSTVSRPGKERQRKTDRLDAQRLAKAMRNQDVSYVVIPEATREAHRDRWRCWRALRKDLKRVKMRINSFLHYRGLVYREGKSAWTIRHMTWIRGVALPLDDRRTLQTYLNEKAFLEAQMALVMDELKQIAQAPAYRDAVGRLQCFKGIELLTALALVLEIGDFKRFPTAPALMDYLGLVPSEYSTGETRRNGPMTGAGNARVRGLLIEAAWHYIYRPQTSRTLMGRQAGQPPEVIAHAWKAQVRLYQRYHHLLHTRDKGTAIVGVARELAGFVWAVMQ